MMSVDLEIAAGEVMSSIALHVGLKKKGPVFLSLQKEKSAVDPGGGPCGSPLPLVKY